MTTLEMEVDSDNEYEQVSQADISSDEEEDFVEARRETPSSTPPTLTPPTATSTSTSVPRCRTKRFACTWDGCTKAFVRQSRLDEHLRTHTNTRPFTCPYEGCDHAYFRASHLNVHIKSAHTEEKDYKCTWQGCGKSFATGQRLKTHLLVHQGDQKYKCTGYQGCTEAFRKKEMLRRHVASVHEQKKPFPCPDFDSMTGDKCTREFDTAQKLRTHQKTNHDEKRFSCADCLSENESILGLASDASHPALKRAYFATMAQLQFHNAEFHPPVCPQCQTVLGTQRQLAAHLEVVHDIKPATSAGQPGKAEIVCPYPDCGKTYSKKGNLNVHIRTFHEKSVKFTCGQTQVALKQDEVPSDVVITGCGKNFTSKQVLEDHIRTAHLGLTSVQTRRKRKARTIGGRRMKRARVGTADNPDEDTSTNASDEIPDYVWPAIGYDDSEDENEGEDPDDSNDENADDSGDEDEMEALSGSMSMLGNEILYRGRAYNYQAGEYPSSSNSLEMDPAPHFPAANEADDGFFVGFEDAPEYCPIDPRLYADAALPWEVAS